MSSHLERNLHELLRRHQPVAMDVAFRERLGVRVREEAARLFATRHLERALAPAPRAVRPRWIPVLAAAASFFALLTAGWWLWSGASAPSKAELLARFGAVQRTQAAGDWQAVTGGVLVLEDGHLEVTTNGRTAVRIELPELGSVELGRLAEDLDLEPELALDRRERGPARARMLRGEGLARLPVGDVPLPEGCDLILDRDGSRDFAAAGAESGRQLPEVSAGTPEALEVPPAPVDEPVPPGAVLLQGRVTRVADGSPVTRPRLILVQSDITAQGPKQIVHEVEDEDGRFRWIVTTPGRYHLFVQAEGLAVGITRHVLIDPGLVLPPLDIALEPGRTLSGRVVDAGTGAPVEGALVLSDTDAPAIMLAFDEQGLDFEHLQRTHTDADGRFALAHLRSDIQVLRATHAGRAPAFVEASPQTSEVELRLPAGASLEGDVRHEDGTIWPAALVIASFMNATASGRCMNYGFAVTDAEGHYRMDDLPPAPGMVLMLGTPDDVRQVPAMESVVLSVGQTARVDFPRQQAETTGTLVGFMAEADGTPAVGRMVSVMARSWEESGHFAPSMVDENGAWRIEKLPPDNYAIYAVFDAADGTVSCVGHADVAAGAETHASVRLPEGGVAGRVLGPDGKTVGRMDLSVEQRDATGDFTFIAHMVSDEVGAYRGQALSPGVYRVTAFDYRAGVYGAARSEAVLVGTDVVEGVDIQLDLGGDLRVVVHSTDGSPVAGVRLVMRDARGSRWDFGQFQHTGPDGSFAFRSLPTGAWEVEAVGAGGVKVRTTVVVRPGETAQASLVLPGG